MIEARGYIQARITEDGGCWVWNLSRSSSGYGNACFSGVPLNAHRLSFMAFKGAIPEGYEVDHLCKNKICVNPAHLEAVPKQVNIRRQFGKPDDLSVCANGHPASEYAMVSGRKVCRACMREKSRQSRKNR